MTKKAGGETVNRFDYKINVLIISWIRNGIYPMKFSTTNKRTQCIEKSNWISLRLWIRLPLIARQIFLMATRSNINGNKIARINV